MKRKINGMKNLLLGLAALIGMSGLLSGCSLSANSVKLHTQKEMQEIVNEKYGEAEFIGMEENKEAHKRIFTFRDKKYGFTYQTMSHPHGVGMDGSTFYYDGATIWYGYEEPFLEYFKETEGPVFAKQGIELCDDLKFAKASGSVRKFDLEEKILYSTSSKWESDLAFTWERYQEYASVPELHRLREIKVYDTDQGIFLGNMSEEGFVTAENLPGFLSAGLRRGIAGLCASIAQNPLPFTLVVVVVCAFLLLRISERSRMRGDSAIALISTSALALGVIVTSMTSGMNVDVYNYMFGSILAMSRSDVYLSVALSLVVLTLFALFYPRIFAVTFDEAFARATGVKAGIYNMLIAMLTAMTVVVGMRMMGTLLISSLIIFPALSSMRVFSRFRSVVISSAVVSVGCFVLGLMLSCV